MHDEKKSCKDIIDTNAIKEEIKRLSNIDKSLIPQYLDSIKQNQKTNEKEITKDNPYYKFL